MITRICGMYFSPCSNVKKIVEKAVNSLANEENLPFEIIDFTLPEKRDRIYEFSENDFIFLGVPVYAGRVPNKIMPFIKECIRGNGTMAAGLVAYGNRNFDDALSELRIILDENGFNTIAAMAAVTQHSFSDLLASGRPNTEDLDDAADFLMKAYQKSNKILNEELELDVLYVPGNNPPSDYYVPKGIDGKPAKFLKAVPKTNSELCTKCGLCAKMCPMGSIDSQNVENIIGICIKCSACINNCPTKAKYFDDEAFLSHKQMLIENFAEHKDNKYFY